MRLRAFILAAAALFFVVGLSAQTITVRVHLVYYSNGKPAKGNGVVFIEGDPKTMPQAGWRDGSLAPKGVTGADGTATFRLSPPFPKVVFPSFDDPRIEACETMPRIPLKEVMAHGFTVSLDEEFGKYCKGSSQILERVKPAPGEILIFVRKRSFWEIYG